MDTLTPEERSRCMSLIRAKNTKPEKIVRSMLHGLGYRFRLHSRDLPGTPDIVFRKAKKAIFVHGCFWHGHAGCPRATIPSTRVEFWTDKIAKTHDRDQESQRALSADGWKVFTVWECNLKNLPQVTDAIVSFLKK